jgi:hypothetical protein
MTLLTLALTIAPSLAAEPLGSIDGVREVQAWSGALAFRGGASMPMLGPSSAWGAGPQLGLVGEAALRRDASFQMAALASSHGLRDPASLLGLAEAPVDGSAQLLQLRLGFRWSRAHHRLEPGLAGSLGARLEWTHLDLPGEGGVTRASELLIWPQAHFELSLLIHVLGPLSLRGSLGSAVTVGLDPGEVPGDTVFTTVAPEAALELVARIP